MAYRADIEIAVKGAQELKRLQDQISAVAQKVKQFNADATRRGVEIKSIQNMQSAVAQANQTMRSAAAGTKIQKDAIDAYVKSLDAAEKAELDLAKAIKTRQRELNITPRANAGASTGGGIGKRVGGAVSGAIIGGAFPLLFGQGGSAATGGALGGLIGGLAGPGGSFAGSLLGTLIGDIVGQKQQIKDLGTDIGFSAQQTTALGDAFKKANTDVEKFTSVIQNIRGLGLELKDQAELIKLTTTLVEKYGGQFDKVGNAVTSALESGKVSQATLNQLTSQGINIQQALANKLGVSRDTLLDMAKKGKISVQDLVDTLVDLGNKGVTVVNKTTSGFDQLKQSFGSLGTAIMSLGGMIVNVFKGPFDWLLGVIANIVQASANGINIIRDLLNMGSPEKVKTIAAVQQGRLPTGTAGVEALIGTKRMRTLQTQAGPGFLGMGFNESKFIQLLQKQPEFALNKPTPIKPINVRGLGQAVPSGTGSNKASKAAAREALRVSEAIKQQKLLTFEQQRQKEYAEKIFAAEMAKDPILARRIQGEQQLAEWTAETGRLLEKENNTAVQYEIILTQLGKKANIVLKTQQDMTRLEKERTDNAKRTTEGLQNELDIKSATTQAERDRLRIAYEMKLLEESKQYTTPELATIKAQKEKLAAPILGTDLIKQQVGALTDELMLLSDVGTQVTAGAKAIGAAFRDAFNGLVSGAMTGQEALAAFFQGVGNHFTDMAAQMIAKLIEIWILETTLGFISGGGMGLEGATKAAGKLNSSIGFGAGTIPKFADGGMVTRPTLSMVGEGGQPEYIIPASKMRGAMNRYAAGARGSAVIPAGDGGDGGTATMVAAPGAIDVRYTVERINSVDYVTADQFQQGMRQAAQQGAAQGEQRTLRRLQNSTGTRRRIGI